MRRRAPNYSLEKNIGLGFALAPALAILFILIFAILPVSAQETGLETRYALIVFTDEADLYEFGKKLGGPGSMVSRANPNVRAHVKESVDRIVFRVKALLDMHPDAMKFTIVLHSTEKGLNDAYRGLGAIADPPIAFYSHKSRTIHMILQDASDGVFAHEVAHAVINFYFTVPPPAQMQEILAQYVDRHLNEN
ncbi:MAG: hypothetical protein HYV23_08470 [Deltaproteobacteria bacterium]|nr:hypothetical protein [Deltaproteobacteria bacterium]